MLDTHDSGIEDPKNKLSTLQSERLSQSVFADMMIDRHKAGDDPVLNAKGDVTDPNGLFLHPSDPDRDIRPENIIQGEGNGQELGPNDCALISAMQSLASTPEGRAKIAGMFKDNGDGTYNVHFPGIPDAVTVDAPSPNHQDLMSHSTTGSWVTVMETGYQSYMATHKYEDNEVGHNVSEVCMPDAVMSALTGEQSHFELTSELTPANADQLLIKFFQNNDGQIMTAGISDLDNNTYGIRKLPNADPPVDIDVNHAYAVMGYDPATKMVMLSNPHGYNYSIDTNLENPPKDYAPPHASGVFSVPLQDFMSNFDGLQYTYSGQSNPYK